MYIIRISLSTISYAIDCENYLKRCLLYRVCRSVIEAVFTVFSNFGPESHRLIPLDHDFWNLRKILRRNGVPGFLLTRLGDWERSQTGFLGLSRCASAIYNRYFFKYFFNAMQFGQISTSPSPRWVKRHSNTPFRRRILRRFRKNVSNGFIRWGLADKIQNSVFFS